MGAGERLSQAVVGQEVLWRRGRGIPMWTPTLRSYRVVDI
jgi:hypothetical protein